MNPVRVLERVLVVLSQPGFEALCRTPIRRAPIRRAPIRRGRVAPMLARIEPQVVCKCGQRFALAQGLRAHARYCRGQS